MPFFKNIMKKRTNDRDRTFMLIAPTGVSTLSAELQMKYAKGVQYNMKVVIKGDRNVGKTTLFKRLQGAKFCESYKPTNEIQVANIQWNYKATDDIVKVELWDVVDQGRRKSGDTNHLKLSHAAELGEPTPCLDASFVDVYKAAHAVIIMYDITKSWTWTYVENELPNIPIHLPIIILANNRDMGQHRTVELDTMRYYISSLSRGSGAAPVRYAESSMKNGFGLKFLHTFFNIPFLTLQRNTLLKQLEDNARETETLDQELDLMADSDDFNYDTCLERQQQKMSTPPTRIGPTTIHTSMESSPRSSPLPARSQGSTPSRTASTLPENVSSTSLNSPFLPPPNRSHLPPGAVDEFKPDQMEDKSFFEDFQPSSALAVVRAHAEDSDSSEAGDNPMVAGFQDDLESEDEVTAPAASRPIASADIQLSSEDEESPPPDLLSESEEENLVEKLQTLNFTSPPTGEQSEPVKSPADKADVASVSLSEDEDDVSRPDILGFGDISSDEEVKTKVPKPASPTLAKESKPRKKKQTKTAVETGDAEKSKKKKTKKGTDSKKKKSSKQKDSAKPIDPLEAFLNDDGAGSQSRDYDNF